MSASQHTFSVRNVQRASRILAVLATHGWGHYLERMRLKGDLRSGTGDTAAPATSGAGHLRSALEELGPTFVKFGQHSQGARLPARRAQRRPLRRNIPRRSGGARAAHLLGTERAAHVEPHFEGIPVLGLAGYGIATLLGLWWAAAILRSGI